MGRKTGPYLSGQCPCEIEGLGSRGDINWTCKGMFILDTTGILKSNQRIKENIT